MSKYTLLNVNLTDLLKTILDFALKADFMTVFVICAFILGGLFLFVKYGVLGPRNQHLTKTEGKKSSVDPSSSVILDQLHNLEINIVALDHSITSGLSILNQDHEAMKTTLLKEVESSDELITKEIEKLSNSLQLAYKNQDHIVEKLNEISQRQEMMMRDLLTVFSDSILRDKYSKLVGGFHEKSDRSKREED